METNSLPADTTTKQLHNKISQWHTKLTFNLYQFAFIFISTRAAIIFMRFSSVHCNSPLLSFSELSDEEVLINSVIFIMAAYDTTATTILWMIYELAIHPDIQDKLINAIDNEIADVRCF